MKTSICKRCGRPFRFDEKQFRFQHFCGNVSPGNVLSCKALQRKQVLSERKQRERKLTADLNGGVELGKHNKGLTDRLRPLTLRSYAEVGAEMGISAQAVRLIELRALSKIRAALLPFRNARSGADKINQVCNPIPSLED